MPIKNQSKKNLFPHTPLSNTTNTSYTSSKLYLNANLSLSYSLISQLANYISQGLSLTDSFSLLGIPSPTYKKWFSIANKELSNREEGLYDSSKDIYLSLLFDTEASLSNYQLSLLTKLNQSNDTKASIFLLERIFKDRYAIQSKVSIDSNVNLATPSKLEIVIKDERDDKRLEEMEKEILLNI